MSVNRIGGAGTYGPGPAGAQRTASGDDFAAALRAASEGAVSLSRHAMKRVERRELGLDAGRMERLNTAITNAAQKGARQSVVVLDDLAVVVNVRERTVVTAMNAEGGRQRVFTNIDSVVIG